MGILERCMGSDATTQRRGLHSHALSSSIVLHALNAEFPTEAAKGTRQELIDTFDLRTETGVTTYPTASYPNETGTYDEGPFSDQEELDAIKNRYDQFGSLAQKTMYYQLLHAVFECVHAGTITPAEGRDELRMIDYLPGGNKF